MMNALVSSDPVEKLSQLTSGVIVILIVGQVNL